MKNTEIKNPTAAEIADFCVACAEEKQGENTVVIPMGEISSIADFFVVTSAESEPQLRAIGNFIERQMRERFARRPLSQPGDSVSGWILLDFGDVIVHVMSTEARERYDLEGLWGRR